MTTANTDVQTATDIIADINNQLRNEVTVMIGGQANSMPMDSLGVSMDSTDEEIRSAVTGIVEELGSSLVDEHGIASFAVRRATNTNQILVYPKPVAG